MCHCSCALLDPGEAPTQPHLAYLHRQSAVTRFSALLTACTGVVRSLLPSANFWMSVLTCAAALRACVIRHATPDKQQTSHDTTHRCRRRAKASMPTFCSVSCTALASLADKDFKLWFTAWPFVGCGGAAAWPLVGCCWPLAVVADGVPGATGVLAGVPAGGCAAYSGAGVAAAGLTSAAAAGAPCLRAPF